MKFEAYPHDTQTCSMKIESLHVVQAMIIMVDQTVSVWPVSYTTDDLVFAWQEDHPLEVDETIELPQHILIQYALGDCTQTYTTGNFTCIEVIFTLKRRLGYYLFHTYIPTCLIVIMSWISFWIRPEAVPARVTLCVTSLLTLSTQHAQSQKSLPPVSYIKAIDIFMSSCTVFVFSSLMEYAFVNILMGDSGDDDIRLRNMVVKLPRMPGHRKRRQFKQTDAFTRGMVIGLKRADESRFCLSSDSRRVRVWRRRGERSNPAAIVERPTVRQRGIMVWGAIAYDSRSPLLRIQGTMTAQRYVDDVLRPVTLPYLQGVPNALYQQDNARPHTARISQQALQDVQMLPWPPYSSDLSTIEHVWDIIGRRLHSLPQPRSEDELWQMVEREWRAIPQDAIRTLIDSLPRRVAACIASCPRVPNGSRTSLLQRRSRANLVDKVSRIVFPLSFLILNAIYWTYYLSGG
ncbi:hypothetical protein LAZ67_11003208 [Cordylochernes scorpioides]|uniref:Uncharacterized protein n=1 Tax=Cordylochernes scorpioides TaxID=51811 RepID=A0ABY6KZQ7_9ARAC|nr:hypothetical protein LAZ67_11003208 [Cordylochernes scorpioides]